MSITPLSLWPLGVAAAAYPAAMRSRPTSSIAPLSLWPHGVVTAYPAVMRTRAAAVRMQGKNMGKGIGGDFQEGQMKNINKAGPSEARMKAVEETMRLLRERGKAGSSSIMDESMAELGIKRKPGSPPPAPVAPPASPPPLIAATMEELMAAASNTTRTSGIGGAWTPSDPETATEEKKHKPKGGGSWGVFERPADISKAFGGGKRIGVGGFEEDEETRAKKRAETDALLQKYRQSTGSDLNLEQEHAAEISAAREEAKQLMLYGDRRGAIALLEGVQVRPLLWPFHEIVITNIVWCIAYKREVGRGV